MSLPRAFRAFDPLRYGSIRAEGWLRDYEKTIADGWMLLYAENREPWVYSSFWTRFSKSVPTPYEDCEAPDYSAYFADGFVRLAHQVPESGLAKELDPWLRGVVASQDADGYLGTLDPPGRWNHWLEVFSQSLMVDSLLYHSEVTGDATLFGLCQRAIAQPIERFSSGSAKSRGIFGAHSTCLIRTLLRLYARTGEERYRRCAADILADFGKQKEYLSHRGGDVVRGGHNVIECEHMVLPAILSEFTGERDLLESSLVAWDMMQKYLCVDGTPHGNEGLFPPRSRGNCEHCGAVEWAHANLDLLRITGEARFADAAERALFNGYPAAKSPDCMALAYMHSPNQLYATDWSGPHGDDFDFCDSKQYFSTAHSPLCCNAISARAMPFFTDSLVLGAPDGLVIACYAPCQVAAVVPGSGLVRLLIDTAYPFEDEVRICVDPQGEALFTLMLRIPTWCQSASIEVDGRDAGAPAQPGTFARIRRTWKTGETVVLKMQVPVRLVEHPRSYRRVGGVAVVRGPLTFCLPVAEKWERFSSVHNGPGKETISYLVTTMPGSRWNYALVCDTANPEGSFAPARLAVPAGAMPWQFSPIGLKAKVRRVENWTQEGNREHPMTPGLPFEPMVLSRRMETATLVPFGFTRLRMSYLPIVCSGGKGD